MRVRKLLTASAAILRPIALPTSVEVRKCSPGKVELDGPRELIRGMPRWFGRSEFADDNTMPVA